MTGRLLRLGVAAVCCSLLTAGFLCAETITVIQGPNSWTIRALHDVISYDMTVSVDDPTALATTQVDIDSPFDQPAGELSDGNRLRFYRLDELGREVADFYGYSSTFPSSAASALSKADTARVFFHFDDTTKEIALVIVLDKPDDGDGGQADVSVSGLPPTAFWSVEDDPNEGFAFDPVAGVATATWNWLDCCTDGGAISGISSQDLLLDVDFTWRTANGGRITGLEFLTGTGQSIDDYNVITLNEQQPFQIEVSANDQPASYESRIDSIKHRPDDTVRIAWADLDRVPRTVDPASPITVRRECVLADGVTPAYISVIPQDANGVMLGTGLDVVPDPLGLGPGWLDGPMLDLGSGFYVQSILADAVGIGSFVATVDGLVLSNPGFLRYTNSRPDAEIILKTPGPYIAPKTICFEASTPGAQGGVQFTWDLNGDGQIDSNSRFPCYRYEEEGEYAVFLEVVDAQPCWDRQIDILVIEPPTR